MDSMDLSGPSVDAPMRAPVHTIVGLYLLALGAANAAANLPAVLAYLRRGDLRADARATLCASLLAADLGVVALHPFSGLSALANRWLFGRAGCLTYAFVGFVAGGYQCQVAGAIAYARFGMEEKDVTLGRVLKWMALMLLHALFWSVAPLVGWASYCETPTHATCSIDWTRSDGNYASFILLYTACVYLLPLAVGARALLRSKRRAAGLDWLGLLGTYIAFSAYGLVALWPLAAPASAPLPHWAHITPPVVAKLAGAVNAYVFAWRKTGTGGRPPADAYEEHCDTGE